MTEDLSPSNMEPVNETSNEVTPSASQAEALQFETYVNALSEADRELLAKNNIDSFEAQSKWVNGLNNVLGKKGLINPGEDASDAQKTEYRDSLLNELGRPSDGNYEFDMPDGVKQEWVNDDFTQKLADTAYANGMNPEAFQQLINDIYSVYGAERAQIEEKFAEYEAEIAELKKGLGQDDMDDSANAAPANADSLKEQALQARVEAMELRGKGDHKGAAKAQAKANELTTRLASMG